MFKKLFISSFALALAVSQLGLNVSAQVIALPIPVMPSPTDMDDTGASSSSARSSARSSANNTTSSITVTPTTAADSLITPTWGMNVKTCLEIFNWETYAAEKAAGRSANPYDKKGCLTQKNLVTNSANPDSVNDADGKAVITKNAAGKITAVNYNVGAIRIKDLDNNPATPPMYKAFQNTDNAETKAAFGNMPVLGIFPNAGNAAQGLNTYEPNGTLATNGSNVDRSKLDVPATLRSIYSEAELARIYGSGSARTGAPRLIFTGPDKLNSNPSLYDGGTCYPGTTRTDLGKMKVRTKILNGTAGETSVAPESFGDPANPIVACHWRFKDGTKSEIVLDRNLEVRQFVFVINYPNQAQCTAIWNIPADQYAYCQKFFRDRYGKVLTGKGDGDKLVYTYTYYGMWSDASNICQTVGTTLVPDCSPSYRWNSNTNFVDPDLTGPRANFTTSATEAQLIEFYAENNRVFRVPALASAFGCVATATPGICSTKAVDLPAIKATFTPAQTTAYNTYVAGLKSRYEGYVRSFKGYSVYVL